MEFPWQPFRYPFPIHFLSRDRSLERHLRTIRTELDRQSGFARFALFGKTGRRRAAEIRDALEGECDVTISVANPSLVPSAGHRYRFERYRFEILVRTLDHSGLAFRRKVGDPAVTQLETLNKQRITEDPVDESDPEMPSLGPSSAEVGTLQESEG